MIFLSRFSALSRPSLIPYPGVVRFFRRKLRRSERKCHAEHTGANKPDLCESLVCMRAACVCSVLGGRWLPLFANCSFAGTAKFFIPARGREQNHPINEKETQCRRCCCHCFSAEREGERRAVRTMGPTAAAVRESCTCSPRR